MSNFQQQLSQLDPIGLQEMDAVRLQNRTDTKFIFNDSHLAGILSRLKEKYRVLEVDGHRLNRYQSLYFDTANFDLYNAHQRGKLNRYKVRMRRYVESDLTFLEVKFKNNKQRTIKSRIEIDGLSQSISADGLNFLSNQLPFDPTTLQPTLWNNFSRITLVHRVAKERLTLDTDLAYEKADRTKRIDGLAIAEAKQERINQQSTFFREMRRNHIRPVGMSKYCIGCVLLHPNLRYNNFKPRLLTINKLTDGVHW